MIDHTKFWGGNGIAGILTHGEENCTITLKMAWEFLKNISPLDDLEISFLGIYQKERKYMSTKNPVQDIQANFIHDIPRLRAAHHDQLKNGCIIQ